MENTGKRKRLFDAATTVSAIAAVAFLAYYMYPVAMTMAHF